MKRLSSLSFPLCAVLAGALVFSATDSHASLISGLDNGVGFTLNIGGPAGANVAAGVATLTTTSGNGQRASLFYNTKQVISSFSVSFSYLATPPMDGHAADGLMFVIQNNGAGINALGSAGSGLGYQGITNSVAVGYSIYPWNMQPSRGTTLGVNGVLGPYQGVLPVQLTGTGVPIDVLITYDGTTLKQTLTQGVNSFSNSINIDIASQIGAGEGFVGFTASTGGWVSTQQVSNFVFDSPTQGVPLPAALWGGCAIGMILMTRRSSAAK